MIIFIAAGSEMEL